MTDEKRKVSGLVGVLTNSDPVGFVTRYVDRDADRLGGEIQRQYGLFNDPGKLAEFLLSKHWYWLVGADWSLPSMNIRECPHGPPEEGNPVDLGEWITLLGNDMESVEGFTEKHNLMVIDWLYLIFVNGNSLEVYHRNGDGFDKVDVIPLKAVPKLRVRAE